MQIDHDPRELPRKALKFVAIATAVITLVLIVPISVGMRWAVDQMPIELTLLIAGAGVGASAGFFIGRWDAIRQFRSPRIGG